MTAWVAHVSLLTLLFKNKYTHEWKIIWMVFHFPLNDQIPNPFLIRKWGQTDFNSSFQGKKVLVAISLFQIKNCNGNIHVCNFKSYCRKEQAKIWAKWQSQKFLQPVWKKYSLNPHFIYPLRYSKNSGIHWIFSCRTQIWFIL